jgi:hypothetical protein
MPLHNHDSYKIQKQAQYICITSELMKATPYAACGNNTQARGKVSVRVNKQNITLIRTIKNNISMWFLTHYGLQTKHNNGLAYGEGEPLQCKQPKKSRLLIQVDDTPNAVELEVCIIKNFNDF